ncbi:cytoskeleton-associated protein 5-A isoform X3 [Strongylocentrotus purpuratus]|uniref:TOG domain-containing protein n=1 Tax=Strongylocentrotus purpuratus TaxID=7668 RepID=A0A7M7T0P0_STRPU|nr:cytoskeleton-associated protein 5-A isoform X3 [Strongylocentrotus purpuratus]
MADDQEYLKLPIDEQCVHKVWKARLHGYEEATKLFKKISEEKSPEFSKYAGLLKKFVTDSNAVAQEKGLEAVLAFLESAHVAPRTVGEVTAGVVAKCLNSSRTKTKEKAMEILMVYIELEKQEQVMEELLKGLTNKQPKIVTACLEVMASAVREFGSKVITLKPIVKSVPKVLEHSDKNVREKAKQLAIDLYRWIGAAIKPSLQNIKPVQLKELEEEFEKLPGKAAKQTRFLKSQQDLKAKAQAQEDGEEEEEEDEADTAGPAIDPYDLLEPVDILAKLPKDFYENMEAKKWQTRKEALEVLQPLTANPKIEPGDFAELVRVLKKTVAKDNNVMIVALAGKCMAGIALGIRKKFSPYAVACISSILDKFKEKKINVVTALREAIDAIFPTTTFQNILEDVLAALDNKNPSIRTETALFLGRAFRQCTPATLPKAILKPLCISLVKKLSDTTPDCREAASETLATALKVVGEKPMNPFLADLEKIKLDKIKEYSDKVELAHGGGKKKAKAKDPKSEPGPSKEAPAAKAAAKAPPKAKSGKTAKSKSKSEASASGKTVKGGKKKAPKNESQEETKSEPFLTDEEVQDKAEVLLSASILTQLASSNWKERLAAMEEFTKKVENMEKNDINAQVFVRVLAKKPGFKEANFQVMNAKIALVGFLAEKARFSRRCAQVVIAPLIDKIGDTKSGSKVKESLTAVAEACQLGYIAEETITYAFEKQKNPKNQAELLNWFAQAIQEFGFSTVTPKKVIAFLKTAVAAVNPQVRTAAISLLGVMYMYMGANLRMLFDGEKAALLVTIDAEIEKVSGQKAPAPFRGIASKKDDKGDVDEDDEEEEDEDVGGGGAMNMADLIPRTDISGQITTELVAEMGDTKWKIRGEALEKVTGILKEAKFITPNLGDLPTALKGRLGDSNKNLAQTTANILATIAAALGPASKQHVKNFAAGLLLLCGDSKPSVRAAATASLTAWEEQTGLAPFIEDEILVSVLAKDKPVLRSEIFGWLETRMGKYRSLPSELSQCVPHLLAGLEDRSADVRKNATAVLPLFMMHLTYEKMVKMTGKLKASSKDQVVGIMEKQRANIPAKPGKPEKATKAAKKETSRPSTAAPTEEPESKKESAPTKRPKTAPAKPVQNDTGSTSSLSSSASAPPSEGASSKGKAGKGASAKGKAGKPAPSKKKKDEDEETGPALIQNNGKDRRLKDESDLKVLKWNFTTPRAEYVDQLKDQIQPCVSKTLFGLLFHADFKKHIVGVGILTEYVESSQNAIKSNLDVLLKWSSLRFFDTNTSVLVKMLEFLRSVFTMLSSIDYSLLDQEANSFIPYLILKIGDPKENVRKDVKAVIKLLTKIYPASKMFGFLMDGIKSKNARQRTECLDELGILIELYGLNVCQPSPPKALKEVASQIADRDNTVRSAALNTLVQVYSIVGENVYKYIGNLNEKEMSLLEERIKRSGKKPAPAKTEPAPSKKNTDEKTAKGPDAKKSNLPPGWRDAYRNPGKGQRPATAPPKQPGNQSSAPKVFSLDLDQLGLNDDEADLKAPELEDTEVNDLLEKPVVLPKRKVQKSAVPTMMQLNFMISQIASNDIAISIQALAQLDEILKEPENTKAVVEHADQLLIATSLQLRMAFSKHMGDEITSKDVIRMYRCLAALLVSVFQNSSLSQRASKDVLCDLINGLITVLIDDRLMSFDDGPQVVRSFNIVMAKVVENSNHNAAMGALIKLLQECVARESGSTKFASLIMKCLWRLVRTMPNIINELNVDRILLDLHQFLKAFPSSVWRDLPSDTPLRTVKTILHSLAKILGQKVLNHLTLIPDTKDSEVESYLKKVLRSGSVSSSSSNDHINGSAPDLVRLHSDKNVKQSPRRTPARTNDLLALIFQKIGSNENTREGLAELYDFKQKYPEVDIDPFLKKTSQYFQAYITHGLQNIAKERGEKNIHTTNVMVKDNQQENNPEQITSSNPRPDGDGTDSEPISDVLGRIKVLRARCGLENAQEGMVENLPKTAPPAKQEISAPPSETSNKEPLISLGSSSSNLPATAPQLAPLPDVDDLKKRLEKIKNSCK